MDASDVVMLSGLIQVCIKAIEVGVTKIISWSKQKEEVETARHNGEREAKESAFMTDAQVKIKEILIKSYEILQLCEAIKGKLDSEAALSKQLDRIETNVGQVKDLIK